MSGLKKMKFANYFLFTKVRLVPTSFFGDKMKAFLKTLLVIPVVMIGSVILMFAFLIFVMYFDGEV